MIKILLDRPWLSLYIPWFEIRRFACGGVPLPQIPPLLHPQVTKRTSLLLNLIKLECGTTSKICPFLFHVCQLWSKILASCWYFVLLLESLWLMRLFAAKTIHCFSSFFGIGCSFPYYVIIFEIWICICNTEIDWISVVCGFYGISCIHY